MTVRPPSSFVMAPPESVSAFAGAIINHKYGFRDPRLELRDPTEGDDRIHLVLERDEPSFVGFDTYYSIGWDPSNIIQLLSTARGQTKGEIGRIFYHLASDSMLFQPVAYSDMFLNGSQVQLNPQTISSGDLLVVSGLQIFFDIVNPGKNPFTLQPKYTIQMTHEESGQTANISVTKDIEVIGFRTPDHAGLPLLLTGNDGSFVSFVSGTLREIVISNPLFTTLNHKPDRRPLTSEPVAIDLDTLGLFTFSLLEQVQTQPDSSSRSLETRHLIASPSAIMTDIVLEKLEKPDMQLPQQGVIELTDEVVEENPNIMVTPAYHGIGEFTAVGYPPDLTSNPPPQPTVEKDRYTEVGSEDVVAVVAQSSGTDEHGALSSDDVECTDPREQTGVDFQQTGVDFDSAPNVDVQSEVNPLIGSEGTGVLWLGDEIGYQPPKAEESIGTRKSIAAVPQFTEVSGGVVPTMADPKKSIGGFLLMMLDGAPIDTIELDLVGGSRFLVQRTTDPQQRSYSITKPNKTILINDNTFSEKPLELQFSGDNVNLRSRPGINVINAEKKGDWWILRDNSVIMIQGTPVSIQLRVVPKENRNSPSFMNGGSLKPAVPPPPPAPTTTRKPVPPPPPPPQAMKVNKNPPPIPPPFKKNN